MTLPANKTKIVCTIGPASESQEVIERMLIEAMDGWNRNGQKLLELLSALDFASLTLDTDRRSEARTRLAYIYGGFDEGLETGPLVRAREMLERLA